MIPVPELPANLQGMSDHELAGAILAFLAIGDRTRLLRVQAEQRRRQRNRRGKEVAP